MLREEEKDEGSGGNWKTYSRSMSWSERPQRKPLWNSKARACLPPLQPLCIIRPSIEEWPKAGSDDIGVWPTPSTPSSANPGSVSAFETCTSIKRHALFDKECSKVLDHVYLGCNAVAKDREILRQNGITHILNCVGYSYQEHFKNELVYKTLWLQDCPSEDITSVLYDVFDYFEEVREQHGRVLVHCCRGVSRSTSLVIAYLMWKQGMSFNDAFQNVKAARGVADPNVGFACQLMQCQKRVHALPPSPNSYLRMYRMAPHSPYDPLHLVPKMVSEPGAGTLDSRGAFIVLVPSAIFVWIGEDCTQVMSDNAVRAANQIIRYERAEGRVIPIKEKEETPEFLDSFSCRKGSTDAVCEVKSEAETKVSPVDKYDSDFQVFHSALAGGVFPSLMPGSESETCVPTRDSGWNVSSVRKDVISPSSKVNKDKMDAIPESHDECKELDETPDSSASYLTCSSNWTNDELNEPEVPVNRLSRSPSFSLIESFSLLYVRKHKSSSPSSLVSPSTSDYSSSFTFSPSSSNCSDLSPASASASAQPSPYRLESRDTDLTRTHSAIGFVFSNSPDESPDTRDCLKPEK